MTTSSLHIVLTIHHHLDPNLGAPGVTLRLAEEYESMGHDVHIVSYDDLPDVIPRGPWQSIVFPLFLVWYLTWYLAHHSVDVVDTSTGDAWLWSLRPRSARSPLLVVRNHGLEHRYYDELFIERALRGDTVSLKRTLFLHINRTTVAISLRRSDLCLLLNREDAQYAVKRLGVAAKRIEIVRNGLSDAFLGRPAPEPRSPDEPLQLAFVGSYHPRKGTAYLESALRRFLPDAPQSQITFFGTGRSEADVRSRFPGVLQSQIDVVPAFQNADLPDLLQGYHVLLLPSVCEGFGVALIEAMACGLAPVTTNIQGPAEIVTHEQDGVLVPPRDGRALTAALRHLSSDLDRLNVLRANAHRTAQAYDWTRIAHTNVRHYVEHAPFLQPPAAAK